MANSIRQQIVVPVSSVTGMLCWKTNNGLAMQEPDTPLCSRGPQTRTSWLQSTIPIRASRLLKTDLPHSRAHTRGGTALSCCHGWCQDPRSGTSWGNHILPSSARAVYWACVARSWQHSGYKCGFCEKLLQASPTLDRANASQLQDGPAAGQG